MTSGGEPDDNALTVTDEGSGREARGREAVSRDWRSGPAVIPAPREGGGFSSL